MKKVVVLVVVVALLMTGCLETAEDRAFEASERKREEREQYWHEQEIYDEAFQAGYEAACEEFCLDGDPQSGGYYEGLAEAENYYDQGYERGYRHGYDDGWNHHKNGEEYVGDGFEL